MRRHYALLLAAGLAAAPASAVAGPSNPPSSTSSRAAPDAPPDAAHDTGPRSPGPQVQRFEWSMVSSKGRLGVMVMSLTPELRAHYGAQNDRGVLVARVEPGSAAAQAGVSVGDVLVEVGGAPVDAATDVLQALAGAKRGERVQLAVIRDGKRRTLTATMTDDPSPMGPMPAMGGFERGMFDDPFFDQKFFDFERMFDWFRSHRGRPSSPGKPLNTTRT